MSAVEAWLDEIAGEPWILFAKRLAANDTLATHSHQAGPYIPLSVTRSLVPSWFIEPSPVNPDVAFPVRIDSGGHARGVRLVWYNSKTRNESRVTGWGGRNSPVLSPEATGALAVFAFRPSGPAIDFCRVWICRTIGEEDAVEARLGPVEPKRWVLLHAQGVRAPAEETACRLTTAQLPAAWRDAFPSGEAIVEFVVERLNAALAQSPDKRILARRECEYGVFRSVEENLVLPRIKEGFPSVEDFIAFAGTVANRRKARSGRSLELQLSRIFTEEGVAFDHGKVSEGDKRPDFLFPSAQHYRDPSVPADKLLMLAAKTTCKDRWRQILNEASRIPRKHLFTLQEGVSEAQYAEMSDVGVQLVVPADYRSRYPASVRGKLQTLDEFIAECRQLERELGLV